jgi:hypothetical protein
VRFRLKGEPPRSRTFKRLTDAKAWARAAEADLGRGEHVPTTTQRRIALADLIDKYVAEKLPLLDRATDARDMRRQLVW